MVSTTLQFPYTSRVDHKSADADNSPRMLVVRIEKRNQMDGDYGPYREHGVCSKLFLEANWDVRLSSSLRWYHKRVM